LEEGAAARAVGVMQAEQDGSAAACARGRFRHVVGSTGRAPAQL